MKNWLSVTLAIGFIGLVAFQNQQTKKVYRVEQSLEWWSHTLNAMEAVKTQLKQSDLPSKNVVYLTDSIFAPIQMEMTKQLQAQLNAEIKKTDTLKSKR